MNTTTKERYIATLVGCALGDALGMPVEGWKPEQIRKYVGRITEPMAPVVARSAHEHLWMMMEDEWLPSFNRDLTKGEYTDDTILTLAIAEAIAAHGLNLEKIAEAQLKAYEERLMPNGKARGGFGGTTIKGFKNLQRGISPYKSGVAGSPGNGPAMKISPIGIYMDATQRVEEGLEHANLVAKITHLDPRSVASAQVQAFAIYNLLQGISREELLERIVELGNSCEAPVTDQFKLKEAGTLASRLEWVRKNKDATPEQAYSRLGNSSLVFESYPFALFMFQKYWERPVEGLLETVNFGGDSDTTGAIYGALAGAKNGMVFPEKLIRQVKGTERLVKAAEGLYELRGAK